MGTSEGKNKGLKLMVYDLHKIGPCYFNFRPQSLKFKRQCNLPWYCALRSAGICLCSFLVSPSLSASLCAVNVKQSLCENE